VSPEQLRTTVYSSTILQGWHQPVWRSETLHYLSSLKRKPSEEAIMSEPDALEPVGGKISRPLQKFYLNMKRSL